MVELDHDAIKERMVLILQGNASLYDATGAGGLVRQINVGHPDNTKGIEKIFPSIYITNATPLDRITQEGTMTGGSQALAPLLHRFRYKIVLQAEEKDARTTENTLDDFQLILLDTLEDDHKLTNGGAAIVDSSRPEMIETFRGDHNGKPIQGRIITYLLTRMTL